MQGYLGQQLHASNTKAKHDRCLSYMPTLTPQTTLNVRKYTIHGVSCDPKVANATTEAKDMCGMRMV